MIAKFYKINEAKIAAMYHTMMSILDKFVPRPLTPLWNHPAGPKTIFFWAPLAKWLLVLAGINDVKRPVEKVSLLQSQALMLTGFVWSRYSLVIIPKNYSLFAVNFTVGLVGIYQSLRVINYQRTLQRTPEAEEDTPRAE
ncbi:mitochondrial pyruvate carrier 2-like [Babylonia areolata]|uniref:mitochondrial pyruvate carrier 2-like n=1 Tax=Babylonia areolata TaxID=304850 RepID=UPI003FD5C8B3